MNWYYFLRKFTNCFFLNHSAEVVRGRWRPILDFPSPEATLFRFYAFTFPLLFLFLSSLILSAAFSSLKIQANRERTRSVSYSATMRLFSSSGRRKVAAFHRRLSQLVPRETQTHSHGSLDIVYSRGCVWRCRWYCTPFYVD